jgi:hypothetical protein
LAVTHCVEPRISVISDPVRTAAAKLAVPVNVGLALNTIFPVPVTPVAVTLSNVGLPVTFGALMVGAVPNTMAPDPVAPVEVVPSMVVWPGSVTFVGRPIVSVPEDTIGLVPVTAI